MSGETGNDQIARVGALFTSRGNDGLGNKIVSPQSAGEQSGQGGIDYVIGTDVGNIMNMANNRVPNLEEKSGSGNTITWQGNTTQQENDIYVCWLCQK